MKIVAPELFDLDGVSHGFFTREGGESRGLYAALNCGFGSGDEPQVVERNRAMVAAELGVSKTGLLTAWQHHSPTAIIARAPWDVRAAPRADAIVTAQPGLGIGVLTADCAPVLLCDPQAGVVGAAHAGWKGALAGVTDAALHAMESLGARAERVIAVIGPAISQRSYEVGHELVQAFCNAAPQNQRYFSAGGREGRSWFDLAGYLRDRLRAAGVGRVGAIEACTYRDEARFFSYRRATHRQEPVYGRQISAIALRGE